MFTDVKITCQSHIFYTWKILLCSHSDVFIAMFKFSDINNVILNSFQPETIKDMINFIEDKISLENTNISNLYKFAHCYQMTSLLKWCVENIQINSIDTFILGDFYQDKILLKKSLIMLNNNIDDIYKPNWESLTRFQKIKFCSLLIDYQANIKTYQCQKYDLLFEYDDVANFVTSLYNFDNNNRIKAFIYYLFVIENILFIELKKDLKKYYKKFPKSLPTLLKRPILKPDFKTETWKYPRQHNSIFNGSPTKTDFTNFTPYYSDNISLPKHDIYEFYEREKKIDLSYTNDLV